MSRMQSRSQIAPLSGASDADLSYNMAGGQGQSGQAIKLFHITP